MNLQQHHDTRTFDSRLATVGLVDKLLLLANRYGHRDTQIVAKICDGGQGGKWIECAITSIGLLDSGDLLMSFANGDDDVPSECLDLQSLSEIVCQPDLRNHRRLLLGSGDGGKTLFVCRDIDVVGWSSSTICLTFVEADQQMPARPQTAH